MGLSGEKARGAGELLGRARTPQSQLQTARAHRAQVAGHSHSSPVRGGSVHTTPALHRAPSARLFPQVGLRQLLGASTSSPAVPALSSPSSPAARGCLHRVVTNQKSQAGARPGGGGRVQPTRGGSGTAELMGKTRSSQAGGADRKGLHRRTAAHQISRSTAYMGV